MHHPTCRISSLLHSDNLILFTLLLVHLIVHVSPHHSHHFRSHHLSLPQPFTPELKLISLSQILSSIVFLIPSGLSSRILNLYWTKWALVFVYFSRVCYIRRITLSFWVHVITLISYRVVSYCRLALDSCDCIGNVSHATNRSSFCYSCYTCVAVRRLCSEFLRVIITLL